MSKTVMTIPATAGPIRRVTFIAAVWSAIALIS